MWVMMRCYGEKHWGKPIAVYNDKFIAETHCDMAKEQARKLRIQYQRWAGNRDDKRDWKDWQADNKAIPTIDLDLINQPYGRAHYVLEEVIDRLAP